VQVSNIGTATAHGWTLTWTYGGGQQVEFLDGAAIQQQSASVTATLISNRGPALAGSSTTLTLQGKGNGSADSPTVTCTAS
jgi:Cellulose binding domain